MFGQTSVVDGVQLSYDVSVSAPLVDSLRPAGKGFFRYYLQEFLITQNELSMNSQFGEVVSQTAESN